MNRTKKFTRRPPDELNLPTKVYGSLPKRLKHYAYRVKTVQLSKLNYVPPHARVATDILHRTDDDVRFPSAGIGFGRSNILYHWKGPLLAKFAVRESTCTF
jgi:hypothetical protein